MKAMQPRDQLPHFQVRDVTGALIDYGAIWQRRHLAVVCCRPEMAAPLDALGYAAALRAACADLAHADIAYVVTTDRIPGVPMPGGAVVDRWGEVVFVSGPGQPAPPEPSEIAAWAKMTAMRCG